MHFSHHASCSFELGWAISVSWVDFWVLLILAWKGRKGRATRVVVVVSEELTYSFVINLFRHLVHLGSWTLELSLNISAQGEFVESDPRVLHENLAVDQVL